MKKKQVKPVTLTVSHKIFNELILFNQEQLDEYVSRAAKKQVKRDLKK